MYRRSPESPGGRASGSNAPHGEEAVKAKREPQRLVSRGQGRELWTLSLGWRGATIRAYEREPGGPLYLAIPTATGYRRRSLGHRSKDLARREAKDELTRLQGASDAPHDPTIGYLVTAYLRHEEPRVKRGTAKWLRQYLNAWSTYLGETFRVRDLGPREWEAWKAARLKGDVDANGAPVATEQRRRVRPGTVNLGLEALNMALNWAVTWREGGRTLLDRNPVWRLPYLDDPNVRRAVWTEERFEALVRVADGMTMQVEWNGKRQRLPCYLSDIIVIAAGTGRRIGAVRQLAYADLRPDRKPHGAIAWPAETDKGGKAWLTPIAPDVAARLRKVLSERPGLGTGPLFPAPRNASKAVDRETLASWLRTAEQLAGVPRIQGDSFHGLRRKFATERKHLPAVDVAKAAGWRSITTMQRSYVQADDAGVLEAVLDPRRLREGSAS